MLDIYCVATENCNLRCRHCYMCAGPGKEDTTISPENFGKMLANLPVTKTDIAIGGGEIFTVMDHINSYLDLIKQYNYSRSEMKKISVFLQTNGFWLKRKDAREVLGYLKERGVSSLDIASNDEYHREQGLTLDDEDIRLAKKFVPTIFRGNDSDIMPLGRGRSLEIDHAPMNYKCSAIVKRNISPDSHIKKITVRNDGSVSPCCYSLIRYGGNIFSESLESIFERSEIDVRLQALANEGLKGFLLADGFLDEEINSSLKDLGKCRTCAKYLGCFF